MWSHLCDSGSQLFNGIVREWGSNFLGKSSDHHPVILGEAWGREAGSGLLRSTVSVNVGSLLLEIARSWEDEVSIVSTFVSSVSLVDDKGILWDFFLSEVVSSQKINNLGWWKISWVLGSDSKLKSIDSSNIIVEDIETVPLILTID